MDEKKINWWVVGIIVVLSILTATGFTFAYRFKQYGENVKRDLGDIVTRTKELSVDIEGQLNNVQEGIRTCEEHIARCDLALEQSFDVLTRITLIADAIEQLSYELDNAERKVVEAKEYLQNNNMDISNLSRGSTYSNNSNAVP